MKSVLNTGTGGWIRLLAEEETGELILSSGIGKVVQGTAVWSGSSPRRLGNTPVN